MEETTNGQQELTQEQKDARLAELKEEAYKNFDMLWEAQVAWNKEYADVQAPIMKEARKLKPKPRADRQPVDSAESAAKKIASVAETEAEIDAIAQKAKEKLREKLAKVDAEAGVEA